MDGIAVAIITGQIILGVASLILLVYAIKKRIDEKKDEDFEDRTN